MEAFIEVPGIGPATLHGELTSRHELFITKVYGQSVRGSSFMKVAGHALSICHRYPHAKQVCLKFIVDSGLTWQQKHTIREQVSYVSRLFPNITIITVGVD